jgi:hypothetical protein
MADYSQIIIDPLRQIGQGQEFTNRLFDQQAQRQAGQAYASGDIAGARTTLGGRGDIAGVQAIDQGQQRQAAAQREAEDAQRKQTLEFVTQAARVIKGIQTRPGAQPTDTLAAFDQVAPTLSQIYGPEQTASFRQQLEANPASIDAFIQGAERELQFFNTAEGIVAADKGSGTAENVYRIEPRAEPRYVERTLSDGSTEWFDINAAGRDSNGAAVAPQGQPAAPGAPRAAPTSAPGGQGFTGYPDLQAFISEVAPGARFTSGYRDQATQDGLVRDGATRATRSAHTYGLGQDFVPDAPQSEWPAIAARLEESGRFKRVLIEHGGRGQGTGPHIHVEPIVGGQAPARSAPASIPGDQPQPRGGQAGQRAPSGYRYTADGNLEPIPGGPGDRAGRNVTLRPVPAAVGKGVVENRSTLSRIDRALQAVDSNPDAFGPANWLGGDMVRQYTDPEGVPARAIVANIGSQVIHDRSGAAVTVSEFPRLQPFIPTATDSPQTVKRKLAALKAEIESILEETTAYYSEDNGYRPIAPSRTDRPTLPSGNPRRTPAPPAGFRRAGDGAYYKPDPARPGKYLKWTPDAR